jgi:hypothetical protein
MHAYPPKISFANESTLTHYATILYSEMTGAFLMQVMQLMHERALPLPRSILLPIAYLPMCLDAPTRPIISQKSAGWQEFSKFSGTN